jgi:hypothetical protein
MKWSAGIVALIRTSFTEKFYYFINPSGCHCETVNMIDLAINSLNYLSRYVTNLHKSPHLHQFSDWYSSLTRSFIYLFFHTDKNTFIIRIKVAIWWSQCKGMSTRSSGNVHQLFDLLKIRFSFLFKTLYKFYCTIYSEVKTEATFLVNDRL